jgi:hypothetical protein
MPRVGIRTYDPSVLAVEGNTARSVLFRDIFTLHEGEWGTGGTFPCVLTVGTECDDQ